MTNPNQNLIDECTALAELVGKVEPRDGNISVAIGGLHTCRDNLRWHGESQVEKAEKLKAETLKAQAEAAGKTESGVASDLPPQST
jgi:hypothetical protein